MNSVNCEVIDPKIVGEELARMRAIRPLVQCITNQVVQEISANVLLAAGMSPAMVPGIEEAAAFAAGAADALLCNVGTPTQESVEAGKPWALDPVGACGTTWRDRMISELVDLHPAVIRGNGSEILAVAGFAHSYKGVDSMDSSASALAAARALALRSGGVVCVSGETDYATDGKRTICATGGCAMATLVVGTGCSLSALAAGFAARAADPLAATAACCQYVKRAAERAAKSARAPGSFHTAYLDALYLLQPSDFS